jgi:hypothetical protein
MKERINELQNEIKAIEGMLDSMSGHMHYMALEELKNLKFEMGMLNRSMNKTTIRQLETAENAGPVYHV